MSSTTTGTSEKEYLLSLLEKGKQQYLASLSDVDEHGAVVRVAEGKWTILEIAEHVAVAERQMVSLLTKMGKPGEAPREKDALMLAAQENREQKRQAPEPSHPKGRFSSLNEAREAFLSYREATLAFVDSNSADLRAKVVEHPIAGTIDGYQLFLVIASHPARHAKQIEEIKTHPAYPRAK
ncbi:MAG TPA: DinB family protein [Terriglobales bacterium]